MVRHLGWTSHYASVPYTLDQRLVHRLLHTNRYYETVFVCVGKKPQLTLAYEMNWKPLPERPGPPLRLRAETQVGFRMVKPLCSIKVVEDFRGIRGGQGGHREDITHYEQAIPI